MRWHAHVTVAAVIEHKDRFLLIEEEAAGRTVFNQPAGHLEKGESLIEAVLREVQEETRRDFHVENVIGFYLYPSDENDTTYLRVCFSGTASKQHPGRSLDDGIIRTVWMRREEVEQHKAQLRSPLVLKCIDDYLAGKELVPVIKPEMIASARSQR